MDVSNRAVRILLEAAEAASVSRAQVTQGLGIDGALAAPRGRIPWDAFTVVMDRIFAAVGRDPEKLRGIGAHMVRAPSWEPVKVIARSLVSVGSLYDMGNRWISRALFPHVPLTVEFPGADRVVFRGAIPAQFAPSAPLFWLFEGCMREVPRQHLGLEPAVIEESRVTPRTIETRLAYPASASLAERAVTSVRAWLLAPKTIAVLEGQRGEFERGLEAVQRVSDELRDVLERLPDLLAIHRDGKILWVNRALVTTFGYAGPDDLVGRSLVSLVDEGSRDVARGRIEDPGDDPTPREIQARRRDGELLTLELAQTQTVAFGGAPAHLVVARDVTERVKMQQRLITADRLASLGLLAAGVAHEINNPLACALGGVELASTEIAKSAPSMAHAREALDVATEGMDRVRVIVNDLRTLARSDDGRVAAVDVNGALESTLTLAAKPLAARARAQRDYGDVPRARANPARLGQVLLNLVMNAIDAIPEGAPADHTIRVRTREGGAGNVVIEVSDTGVGIRPDAIGRIFDPFFTTKPLGRGMGLGLAICHRIVTELGGEIGVTSTVGAGTTFRVVLPRADAATRIRSEPPPVSGAYATKHRVLAVDDEPRLLEILRQLLPTYDVVTARSVDAALERIQNDDAYDVVLCDVMMPDRSGVDLFVEIERAHAELRDRFLFMTGGTFTAETRARITRTGRPCLDKPFRGADLARVIADVIGDARPRARKTSDAPPAAAGDLISGR